MSQQQQQQYLVPAHGVCSREAVNPSLLLCTLFTGTPDLPQGAYFDYPLSRERKVAAGRYYSVRPILYPIAGYPIPDPNHTPYIGSYAHEYLAGLDVDSKEHGIEWTLGAPKALENWRKVWCCLFFRCGCRFRRDERGRRWRESTY